MAAPVQMILSSLFKYIFVQRWKYRLMMKTHRQIGDADTYDSRRVSNNF